MRGLLAEVGFHTLESRTDTYRSEMPLAERLAFYRQRYSPSQLLAISDEAFEHGLARVEELLSAAPDQALESLVRIVTLVLDKG